MSALEFRKLRTDEELETAYQLLRQLRTSLSQSEFLETYRQAHAQDRYELWGGIQNGECVGVMGARILHDYVHGKHLYIDDLVVDESKRSQGTGARFLKHAETLAKEEGCRGLRLCTGIDWKPAQKFYEREGWVARALAYKKPVSVS